MKPVLNGTDSTSVNLWSYRKNFRENYKRQLRLFFFGVDFYWFFSCFPSLVDVSSLTRKINFHEELSFGYRQDTKQADHAGRKPLSDANCPFCNTDTWEKKASFLAFPILLPSVFLVKALVSLVVARETLGETAKKCN